MNEIILGGYTTTFNAIQSKFPFEASIRNHLQFCKYYSVIDGGSNDGTWERLKILQKEFGARLIISQTEWDYKNPAEMGRTKTLARRQLPDLVTYMWQNDIDELLPECQHRAVFNYIANYPSANLFDFPCITFHGGMMTTNLKENCFKWRLSKNDPRIIHGVPKQFRREADDGTIFFYREESDSCEYIWEHTGEIVQAQITWDPKLMLIGYQLRKDKDVTALAEYQDLIASYLNGTETPCVYHYSWVDYLRKAGQEKFWNAMTRYYRDDGGKPRVGGNKIKKDPKDITGEDIARLALSYYMKETIPLKVNRHPEEILSWAESEQWNQRASYV